MNSIKNGDAIRLPLIIPTIGCTSLQSNVRKQIGMPKPIITH